MKIQKSLKLALNILLHSKLRSWLTILGIVIGVAAMVAIVSIGEGAQASVNARLGNLGADTITITSGYSRAGGFGFEGLRGGGEGASSSTQKNLTTKDIPAIRSVQGIAFIGGMVDGRADIIYLAEKASVSIQGVDPAVWQEMTTAELDSGRLLNPGDTNVIVIGSRLAASTFKEPLALNRAVTIDGKQFKIVGILKSSGSGIGGGNDRSIYMPIVMARQVLDKPVDYFDSISVKVSDSSQVDIIANETDAKLMLERHETTKTKDFTVTSPTAIQANVQSVTQTFTIFLAAIAAVSLLVGAVGIANTMFTSVLEKTKEIGIMKAIGARNIDIMVIFLLNAGLVGLVGGLIGIAFGAGISAVLPSLISLNVGSPGGIKTLISVSLLVEAIVGSILIGMIAGAIPARRASKLKPVDALRYE